MEIAVHVRVCFVAGVITIFKDREHDFCGSRREEEQKTV